VAIEKRYSLNEAAKLAGVSRHTLRRWLEVDLGFAFPDVKKGSKILVKESDVEAVLRIHSPRVDQRLLRRGRISKIW
jgi:excisionase family DNA binding protein